MQEERAVNCSPSPPGRPGRFHGAAAYLSDGGRRRPAVAVLSKVTVLVRVSAYSVLTPICRRVGQLGKDPADTLGDDLLLLELVVRGFLTELSG